MNTIKKLLPLCVVTAFFFTACKKDSYYVDSGIHDGKYNGTVLDYLNSKHGYFDSLVKIIHIAGMDNIFSSEDITFFAPADSSIRRQLKNTNTYLYFLGKDTIAKLEQVSPDVWKDVLGMYLFKGKKQMNDYPQVDLNLNQTYSGQNYLSYSNHVMNIGVVYNDANGVKYSGYRQLCLSYIPNLATPLYAWISTLVASSNIQANNGYVQVLQFSDHYFGFDQYDVFASKILSSGGVLPLKP